MDENRRSSGAGAVNGIYFLLLLGSLGLLGGGAYLASAQHNWTLLGAGSVGLIGVLISWPIAAQLSKFHAASCSNAERALTEIIDRFEQFSVMLNLISEQQLLSDRAKSVAFREKDSDALRRAIQDEILKQNWEGAASLADEMESSFGYKQEAERLRKQIGSRQQDIVNRHVSDVMAIIDRHTRGENWPEALREAQKAAQSMPDVPQMANLPAEVENRRNSHRHQLVESLKDAVARHDVDGGIEIVKRLDAYLTPAEAEGFQDTVRGLFKEKLTNLRTQFSVAVQDNNWPESYRLAEVIVTDFPNTQMAREVREMMETLRARASTTTPGMQPAGV